MPYLEGRCLFNEGTLIIQGYKKRVPVLFGWFYCSKYFFSPRSARMKYRPFRYGPENIFKAYTVMEGAYFIQVEGAAQTCVN
jgi:hypothetical protein